MSHPSTLLLVLAAGAADGSTLLGVGAILAAVVPLGVAYLSRRRNGSTGPPEDVGDELRERIRILKENAVDLQTSLDRCRGDRDLMTTEARLTLAQIGQLEAQLSQCRSELREARARLESAGLS